MVENGCDGFREPLAACVDGQLGRDQREYVLTLLAQDPELKRRAGELRQMKDLMEFADDGAVVPPGLSSPLPGRS